MIDEISLRAAKDEIVRAQVFLIRQAHVHGASEHTDGALNALRKAVEFLTGGL
jgi:hypothetical protein